MHRLTWKSRKFSFQAIQLIILLTTIVTSNAGALRTKRETNDQHATSTPPSKIATESNLINVDTTELEQLPMIADPDAAIDIDTEPSPIFAKSTGIAEGDATPKSTTTQSKNYTNSNDSATEADPNTTTSEYVSSSSVYATTLSSNEKLTDITTGQTATTTTTGSIRVIATMTPKPAGSLPLTTLLQKLDTMETTTEIETTAKPSVSPVDVSQVFTVRSNDTEENTTSITTDSPIDSKTISTTMVNEETTMIAESMVDVNTSRLPTDTNEQTTSPDRLEDTTIKNENFEIATTSLNPDVTTLELQTTTDLYLDLNNQSISDITTIRDTKSNQADITTTDTMVTTMEETTMKSAVGSEVDKVNYDVAINEIKNNATIEDAVPNRESEPRNKYVSGDEKSKEQIATTTPAEITSTSLKTKTTKSHKFIESAEVLKTNDVENLKNSNYTFTSTGTGAANSIENTLEAGQIDDSVLNEKESKGNRPRIPETKQAIKMITSTPTISDILIPSTPSIEKNRVEDFEEVSLKPRLHSDGDNQLSTTEKVQNSIASSIEPSTDKENKTTEDPVDTTTKRIERSTSEPAVTTTTTQKVVNITTVSSIVPLSAIPIDRESESTTAAADEYMEPKRGVLTSTEQHNIDADNKLLTTPVETVILPETTSSSLTSNSVATIESSETNAIVTSTVGSETVQLTSTVSNTTPMQSVKQLSTKPKMKPMATKETPSPATNVVHIVSTEPIEEYSIQLRANQSKEPRNPQISPPSMPSTATTSTEFPVTETTEKVTTNEPSGETDYNVIIAISVSIVGIVALILLVGFLYVMRKRQKSISYGQRCRPVSLDAYSLDNVSIFNSVRRKGALRASKRSYGNAAFDDPSLKHNSMSIHELAKFVDRKMTIHEEFKDVPQIIARPDEVPAGCEDKNRYANVIPLPETRVILSRIGDDEKTEYINANFARGPKDPANYYIACQAPLESTVGDFWRMIWEQNSRVIIMATDLIENGVEKCAEYLPATMTLDNYAVYGDYQITLKSREVKDKYAVSTLHVKNIPLNRWREIIHFWYQWPETGVPSDEASVIAMLLEARSYLKMGTPEQSEDDVDKPTTDANGASGSLDKTKSLTKNQGPLTVHCSPGTGRTGTIITCDIALRSLEMPKRIIDIPQFVYYVRRGRASAVQTKEQYEFIYKVAHMYATKISGPINDN